MVTAEQAAKLGSWGVIASVQPNFDALWGGETGMYAQRLGVDRARGLNPLALLASQGVPLAFGSDTPVTDMNPWATVRAATAHQTPGSAISARAAFAAATRGAWRAGGVRDGVTGTLVPGAPASYAIWEADEFDVTAPADEVQRWSTDPRSRVPVLPRLDGRPPAVPADRAPRVGHPWLTPTSDRAAATPPTPNPRPGSHRGSTGCGRAVVDRLPMLSVTIVAGLALCVSFPPFGYWYAAIPAFALLGWVLTRHTTTATGGLGYGLLFGLVFYLPLLPWISGLVGALPWLLLSVLEALFPALFALFAVLVRRLPGWPLWFAGLWSAQEWLKSTVPFGGFPWGVVGFSQTESPVLPLAYIGRGAAGVLRGDARRVQRVGHDAGDHPLVAW